MKINQRLFDYIDTNTFGPPSKSGVYAVCIRYEIDSKERIVYIGSSKNVSKRLQNNNHPYLLCYRRFENMIVYTKTIITEHYEQLEIELINTYKPILNKRRYEKKGR